MYWVEESHIVWSMRLATIYLSCKLFEKWAMVCMATNGYHERRHIVVLVGFIVEQR